MAGLKKEFNFFQTLAFIVGTMIGSGIFLTPNSAYRELGSPAMLLLVFGLTGVWSLFAQLCYAELGTLINESGAEYSFFKYAFKTGLPAYMFTWVSFAVVRPVSLGIVTLTFARYAVVSFTGDCVLYAWSLKLVAVALLAFLCALNCMSVRLLARFQAALFVAKILVMLFIGILGIIALVQKRQSYLAGGFNGTSTDISNIAYGFYGAQWSYFGWFEANFLVQELNDPRILVKAAFLAVPIVIVCYQLVIVAYMAILPQHVFETSKTVAVVAGQEMIGSAAKVIFPLIIATACLSTGLGSLLASSRLVHEAGKKGDFPKMAALVHVDLNTPVVAIVAQSLMATLFIVAVDVHALIVMLGFTAGVIISGAMLVLLLLRRWEPDALRAIKVPLILPFTVLIPSAIFAVVPFIRYPINTSIAASVMLVSIPTYYFAVERKFGKGLHPYMDRVSDWTVTTIQRFVDVS